MTVEAYLRARIPGYPFEAVVLESAALSPIEVGLQPLKLTDSVEDVYADEELLKSLKYATSTLYYSAAGVFSGGSRTEQVGDVRASLSGFIITQADRDYWRKRGDKLREELGFDPEENLSDDGGMFDATPLRRDTQCEC